MSTTWYATSTLNVADATVAATYEKGLDTSASGANTSLSQSVPANTTNTNYWTFAAPAATGLTDWTTAGYDIQFNVNTCGSTNTYRPALGRRSTQGGSARTGSFTGASLTGTGLKSWLAQTYTNANADASRATTDYLSLVLQANNTSTMSAASVAITVDTTDSYITIPDTVGGGAPSAASLIFDDRRIRRNSMLRR